MSSKFNDFEPLKQSATSPQRSRHQLRRSITELSSPVKLPRHHHLHHHHHRKGRDRDDHVSVSAGPMSHLPRGSLDLLPRSEGTTPGVMTDTGSRPDFLQLEAENADGAPASSLSKDEQIQKERRKAASATTGLRKSLVDLSTFSNATMRRLDDTYYSVLEKLSLLQNTIVAMKEVAGMADEVNDEFKTESQGLVSDIETQLESFGQLDDQQQRIKELQGRIHTGRDKVLALSKRVDVVRERVEDWERADREWQERTRKRLKVLWTIMLSVAFAMMLLYVGAQYAPAAMDVSIITELASGAKNERPSMGELTGNSSKSAAAMTDEVREALSRRRDNSLAKDEALRALDEL
ncbi:Uu.00g045780.m01.CDS01 [Anthostomella pinea]|uniref:Uu.00g045780.m01.CDS01 n=1 Tax=Anthostomella pinea TaxID=933095 RepID=A0AAI8VB85_9PEZI|nr:Uu.00g045780.m01.CDS01 [Anthostomella pinea]